MNEEDSHEHSECQRNDEFFLEISNALSEICGNGRGIEFWIDRTDSHFAKVKGYKKFFKSMKNLQF